MAYFNLNFVTDPPNDELVDEVTQLNNNWQEISDKIDPFNHKPAQFGAIVPSVGSEAYDPEHAGSEHRMAVWNGSTWIRSISHSTTWNSWVDVPIRSPRVIRPNFPVKARINTYSRHVVLAGGVLWDSSSNPWPNDSLYEITTDTSIGLEFAPISGNSYQQGSAGQITTANGFSSAVVRVSAETNRTAVRVRWQGDAGGGNFIMLDGIEWWY